MRELQNTIERSVILADDGEAVPGQYLGIMPKKAKVSELVPVAAGSYSFGGDADSASIVEEAAPMSPPSFASSQSMEEVEKQHILIVLKEVQGNRTRAAEVLDMNIRTLRNKLTKYAEAGEDVSGLSSE